MSNCITFKNELITKKSEPSNKITNYWLRYYDDFGGALKEDWEYFVKYVKVNKAMIFWLFVCLLIIQEYDILSIGEMMMQKGGAKGQPSELQMVMGKLDQIQKTNAAAQLQQKKQEKKEKKKEERMMTAEGRYIEGKKENIKAFGSKLGDSKLARGFRGPSAVSWGKMFDMFKKAFYILGIILAVIGALSLPILIILTLTYFTIRYLVRKITDL